MLIGGAGSILWIASAAKKRSPPFQDTIATLKRDEEGLVGGTPGE
jgi:hypothetical protein